MSKRKIAALLLIPMVPISILIGFWILNYSPVPSFPEAPNNHIEEQPLQHVRISVNLYEKNGQWTRDYITDLPVYASTIAYSISNYGIATASNVQYAIYLDGSLYLQNTILTLSYSESYYNQFSIQATYDSNHHISLTASCEDSSDTSSFDLSAALPRTPSSSLKKLYVTPNDPIVKNTVDSIMRNKFFLYPGWMAIKDWVASNIEYSYDSDRHGANEYWQLPRETILSGFGDCEDYSILTVSLLRAAGWSVNEAYVVTGKPMTGDGSWHAWVRLNVDIIGWQNLEPQSGTLDWLLLGDYFWLGNFDDVYGFNDVNYAAL